jgi:hypothetical protein
MLAKAQGRAFAGPMGFFDRFASKKSDKPASQPAATPAPSSPEHVNGVAPAPNGTPLSPGSTGNVKAQLVAARDKLEVKDLPAAMAIYEELLKTAGDRPDVLVTISGDLGSCGYVEQIVELVAPRYDAERHGPATGLNLLQAYLATRNTSAAQHLLDILFSLERPELEQRLYGFSNALAELIEAERRGQLPTEAPAGPNGAPAKATNVVALVTISKPIWAYGIDGLPGLVPQKPDRTRRVAFAQLSQLNTPDVMERMKKPEDQLGRFCRGFPLWMAETFQYAPHYSPMGVVGTINKEHYAIFGSEWSLSNLRELVSTSKESLDYVFTGTLQNKSDDYQLVLKVWEIKRFRERKSFTARWTPATANEELLKLHEAIRLFMEWTPYPSDEARPYAAPTDAFRWCEALGTSLSLFLADKGVIPASQIGELEEAVTRTAHTAGNGELEALAYLTALDRANRLNPTGNYTISAPLFASPLVDQARAFLNL